MKILNVLIGIVALLYPIGIYFGLKYFRPGIISVVLVLVILARMVTGGVFADLLPRRRLLLAVAAAVVCLAVFIIDELSLLKLYPVLVNLVFFGYFTYSLKNPPTAIERIARLSDPDLSPWGVRYTRKVTIAWCIFFAVNGAVSLWTSVALNLQQWTLYNGVIAYVLMGIMFAIEYPIRIWYRHARHDQ